jgi:hypothetical protein
MRVRGESTVSLRIVQQDGTGMQRRPIPTRKYSAKPFLVLTLESATPFWLFLGTFSKESALRQSGVSVFFFRQ